MSKKQNFAIVVCLIVIFTFAGLYAIFVKAQDMRDVKREADLADIQKLLQRYYSEYKVYPPLNGDAWCGNINDPQNPEVKNLLVSYLDPKKKFPEDPVYAGTNKDYFYFKKSPQTFELYAELERNDANEKPTDFCKPSGNNFDYAIDQDHK